MRPGPEPPPAKNRQTETTIGSGKAIRKNTGSRRRKLELERMDVPPRGPSPQPTLGPVNRNQEAYSSPGFQSRGGNEMHQNLGDGVANSTGIRYPSGFSTGARVTRQFIFSLVRLFCTSMTV